MPRFCKNRCCSFILAFLIGVAGLSVGPASVRAFGVLDDGTSTPGGGVPPSVGDPDEPSGSGRTVGGGTLRQPIVSEAPVVGDGRVSSSAWSWRIQVVLKGLKSFYLIRF